ncbi:hypothetical protein VTL71DRAFT_1547 [Oculimacula yallundae]|uniref:Uncharacterized protein n=1 Tax=Oculimacula yallundae TaxID=86028 RepID=A0ABR4CAZ6_9HELO
MFSGDDVAAYSVPESSYKATKPTAVRPNKFLYSTQLDINFVSFILIKTLIKHKMDVFYSYSYGSAAWLTLQALPLIISPTIIITFLSPDVREATPLEEYFSRSLGLTLLALGTMIILLTGSVPLTSSLADTTNAAVTTEASDPKAPYAVPVLSISLAYHSAMAFYCYARYAATSQFSFVLGAIGSGGLAAIGLWCILFASTSGRISRKTGADKRTSGFPFASKESASAKKRQMGKAM